MLVQVPVDVEDEGSFQLQQVLEEVGEVAAVLVRALEAGEVQQGTVM
jgi:hypothetical protein